MTAPSPLTLCLIADDSKLENDVRQAAPDAHVDVHTLKNKLTVGNVLSDAGVQLVADAEKADAVLAEWHLEHAPILNTLCFRIRRSGRAPVIMLITGSQDDRIASIAAGGDDAIDVPLYLPLLQAKILSYRRLVAAARQPRQEHVAGVPEYEDGRFGALRLDRMAHRFYIRDQEIELTPREFALLDYLIEHGDQLCTRDDILDHVWGITFDTGTNMVDVYMHFLRKKLDAHGLSSMIQTVRGRGYRLVSEHPVR